MRFLLVLCLAGFASSVSWRAADPMLPVMAADLQVTLHTAALLSSAYSFPYAIMQIALGPAGDAFGRVPMIRLSLAVVAASLVLTAVSPSFGTVLAARAVAGAFAGGLTPMTLALMGDRVALNLRQVAIARYLIAAIFGQVFGAAAAGMLVEIVGWRVVFALAAAIVALAGLATILFLDGSFEKRSRLSFRGALRSYSMVLANPMAILLYAMFLTEGAVVLGLFPFVAAMVLAHGAAGAREGGIVIAGFAIGGMAYGFVVRSLVAALGQWNMMRLGGVLAGASLMAMALPIPWIALAGLFVVTGFTFYMLHNTLQTLGTELAPAARASAIALMATSYFTGQGVGPVLGGAITAAAGLGSLFLCFGAACILLGLIGRRCCAGTARQNDGWMLGSRQISCGRRPSPARRGGKMFWQDRGRSRGDFDRRLIRWPHRDAQIRHRPERCLDHRDGRLRHPPRLLQAGRHRHRDLLDRGRCAHRPGGDRGQRRCCHRHRHSRRHRRLFQGRAAAGDLREQHGRAGHLLVCQGIERHQDPQGCRRQDGRLLREWLVEQSRAFGPAWNTTTSRQRPWPRAACRRR